MNEPLITSAVHSDAQREEEVREQVGSSDELSSPARKVRTGNRKPVPGAWRYFY